MELLAERERLAVQQQQQPQKRDFCDVIWQIAEKHCCEEVHVRYDCGHAMKVELSAPCLPPAQDYSQQEIDRQRYMQHCVYVLTKNPGTQKVQIIVPEGRCRCGRGQRQVLVCGPLQFDLSEERLPQLQGRKGYNARKDGPSLAAFRRLDIPLSGHTFLSALGQVSRFPDDMSPAWLLNHGSSAHDAVWTGDATQSREALRTYTRQEIENELRFEVHKYVSSTAFMLTLLLLYCLYLCIMQVYNPAMLPGGSASSFEGQIQGIAEELATISSVGSIEFRVANSTWALTALTVSVHRTFGPGSSESGSFWWSSIVHPCWMALSFVLAPVMWALDYVVAVPRFLLLRVVFVVVHTLIWRPSCIIARMALDLMRDIRIATAGLNISQPTIVLARIPLVNPLALAFFTTILVAAFSSPQPPSVSFPAMWNDLLRRLAYLSRSFGPCFNQVSAFWQSARKEARQRSSRGKAAGASGKEKEEGHGRKNGSGVKVDGSHKGDKGSDRRHDARSTSANSGPACFVCLDRMSCYMLEPCGHKVACGECAVQLVEAAVRSRTANEVGAHAFSDKSGGACPCCGLAINRAMRVFAWGGS